MRVVIRTLAAAALLLGVAAFAISCQTKPAGTAGGVDTSATASTYQPAPAPAAVPVNLAGQQAFLAYCAMCHGDNGTGDGPIAAELAKRGGAAPVNFTDAARLSSLGRDRVKEIIQTGGAHTGKSNLMPSWGEKIEPAILDSLVDYVFQLPDLHPGTPQATLDKYFAAPAGSPENGRRWFVYYCSACHGPEGKGDGPGAARIRRLHNVWPRNLTDSLYLSQKSDEELFTTVSLGGSHAGKSNFMPAWTVTLKPEQIKDLVSYVRVISRTAPKP